MGIYKPGRPLTYNPGKGTGRKPDNVPGEYRIRNEKGKIKYIGESNNLLRRTNQNINLGRLSVDGKDTLEYKVADGRSTSKTRRLHERMKIKQHAPELNRSKGGEGRVADKKSRNSHR